MTTDFCSPEKLEQFRQMLDGNTPRPITRAPFSVPFTHPRWSEQQRLEGEAADRAMIRLLQQELTL